MKKEILAVTLSLACIGAQATDFNETCIKVGELDLKTKEYVPLNSDSRSILQMVKKGNLIGIQHYDKQATPLGTSEIFKIEDETSFIDGSGNSVIMAVGTNNAIKFRVKLDYSDDQKMKIRTMNLTSMDWVDKKIGWKSAYFCFK
jgi:hypothetical protein